jgi:phosphoglucosamine mutase
MQEKGYSLGGEQSGHIIISKYATTGDGILTSLKLMEALLERKAPMSQLAKGLTIYPQQLVNVPATAERLELPAVQAAIAQAEALLKDRGRLLERPSGTEPVIRVMAEADTEELCRKCVELVAQALC